MNHDFMKVLSDMVTMEHKVEEAKKLVFEVWEELVPDAPVLDIYFLQIGMTMDRLISDLEELDRFVDAFYKLNSNLP